jgi:hypothetical protein
VIKGKKDFLKSVKKIGQRDRKQRKKKSEQQSWAYNATFS